LQKKKITLSLIPASNVSYIAYDFRSDGSVHGIDSLTAFNVTLDYYDAGMDYDKIDLSFKNLIYYSFRVCRSVYVSGY